MLGDVTALVKTFLRDQSLFHCVHTLKGTYPDLRVIVADDGHCSDSKESALAAFGVERYLRLRWNRGVTEGRNALIDACRTPFCLILDDDFGFDQRCHVDRLRTLMAVADIAAGRVLQVGAQGYVKPGEWLDYGGQLRGPMHGNFQHLRAKPLYVSHQGVRYAPQDVVLNYFVANLEQLRRVRWDENMRSHPEHEDFFMRAKIAGLRVVQSPDAMVLHQQIDDNSPEYIQSRFGFVGHSSKIFQLKWGAGPAVPAGNYQLGPEDIPVEFSSASFCHPN